MHPGRVTAGNELGEIRVLGGRGLTGALCHSLARKQGRCDFSRKRYSSGFLGEDHQPAGKPHVWNWRRFRGRSPLRKRWPRRSQFPCTESGASWTGSRGSSACRSNAPTSWDSLFRRLPNASVSPIGQSSPVERAGWLGCEKPSLAMGKLAWAEPNDPPLHRWRWPSRPRSTDHLRTTSECQSKFGRGRQP